MENNSIEGNLFCCGCRACEQICPNDAVVVKNDREGFLKAYIDSTRCIECGLCNKVCPAESRKNSFPSTNKMYAAVHKEDAVIRRSSSGGMFTAFAEYVLKQKGCVYGCKFDKELRPVQYRIEDIRNLELLRRSKYVQSDARHTYSQVKKDLVVGRTVLYVGTPCQIAGLRAFLMRPYETLYCVDLICHGVPSAQLFKQDIEYWSDKMKSSVDKYEFRLKPDYYYGYHYFFLESSKNGKKVQKPYFYDPYYEAFYNFKSYNEMCYKCPYACLERVGDITIGDYSWAVEHHPDLCKKNCGKSDTISCVLVNSEAGERLLDAVNDSIDLYSTKLEWITERNKNLLRPTYRPKVRDNFYKDINKIGYKKWAKRYFFSESFLKNIPIVSYVFRVKNKLKK